MLFLTDAQLKSAIAFRHALHRRPEISGEEVETANSVIEALQGTAPDEIISGLGGYGVAAIYRGGADGPTVMIRSELDALPIQEISDLPYRSEIPGKAHLCGHDGHTAVLLAIGMGLGLQRPARGRVVLMFQPSEETCTGAERVIADPRFSDIRPDIVLSHHNFPGLPLGKVGLRDGATTCAARGMKIALRGKTAHAACPEQGIAPTTAVAEILSTMTAMSNGKDVDENFVLATVTHVKMGEEVFGVSPDYAEVWVTLRTLTNSRMAKLVQDAEQLVHRKAQAASLEAAISYHQVCHSCFNADEAVAELRRAFEQEGVEHSDGGSLLPMRPGEDFGVFGQVAPSAMFFLGAGENHPGLHNPDYDFPDVLVGVGASIFMRAIRNVLG